MIWTDERKTTAQAVLDVWQGTPHINRVAIPGIGIDCIRLVMEVLTNAGIVERRELGAYDVQAGTHSVSRKLAAEINRCLFVESVSVASPEFGDLAVFKTGTRSGHIGFVTDGYVWHSLAGRCVTRSPFALWNREIEFLFRFTDTGWKAEP